MTYKYKVYTQGYGGEHTIGTISKQVAEWWLNNKTPDEFEEYIHSYDWDDDKEIANKSIPKQFQINKYWHDLDDIEHVHGTEYASSNYLSVDEVGVWCSVEDIPIDTLFDPIDFVTDEDGMMLNDNIHDEVIVYGQSFEKGGWDYEEIITDTPFDISKLTLSVTIWNGLQIIHAINYEGNSYCNIGLDTTGKSMAFWIDD